ncbi:MAG: hypothetical protein RML99_02625 [Anaerolineae bacterium]|nr:hypothetical protein [Anaerolineae bacterium]
MSDETSLLHQAARRARQSKGASALRAWCASTGGSRTARSGALDVVLGEDLSRVRTGHSADDVAALRRVALSILCCGQSDDEEDERAIEAKRLHATRSDNFLLTVLACSAQNLKIPDA